MQVLFSYECVVQFSKTDNKMEEDGLLHDISSYSTICNTFLVTISIIIALILLVIVGTCFHMCCGCNDDTVDVRSTWVTERRSNNRIIRRKIYKPITPPLISNVRNHATSDIENLDL